MNKPFEGLAFCCTSIPARLREELAHKITSMGGIHYSDLMSDVNYLVVGDRKTDKYNYCVKYRHDVKFVRSDSILKVHDLWLAGEDSIDLLTLENYLIPIFDGLVVCMSRIDHDGLHQKLMAESFRLDGASDVLAGFDVYRPRALAKIIEENGGKVTESLTVGNSCVITTEKKGKRYLKALEWGITTVHPIWVFDSILRMAALKLEDYELGSSETYDNGCKVWDKLLLANEPDVAPKKVVEVAKIRKLDKNTNVWDSIMTTKTSSDKRTNRDQSLWAEDEDDAEDHEDFHPLTTDSSKISQKKSNPKVFTGLLFFIIDFNESQIRILNSIIERNGGLVTFDDYNGEITHILVPVNKQITQDFWDKVPRKVQELIKLHHIAVVTEWFIERSIFYEHLSNDAWGRPLVSMNNRTYSSLEMCSHFSNRFKVAVTGFTGVESLHIQKLITYTKNDFHETLTSKRNLLVININLFKNTVQAKSPQLLDPKYKDILDCPLYKGDVSFVSSKNKINAAKNWKIPIVTVAFLWELMTHMLSGTGKHPTVDDPRWSIYCPDQTDKSTVVENEENLTNKDTTANEDKVELEASSIPQLPSPRKSKKQSYGRIVGRSPQKVKGSTSFTPTEGPDVTFDEDAVTVGYESEQVELNLNKRRRTRGSKPVM